MKNIISVTPLQFPWQTHDPFIFCAYHKDDYPAGRSDMTPDADLNGRSLGHDFDSSNAWRMYHGRSVPGFPQHPHRGFETITIAKMGLVDHADSLGAAGRFGNGDVQWMTAGRGVLHSEMFPLLNQEADNPLELFQIWLNLPAKHKMVDPHFKMLWRDSITELSVEDEMGKSAKINVVAGSFKDNEAPPPPPNSWASDPENEVAIWTIRMEAGAVLTLPPTKNEATRNLFFYHGESLLCEEETVECDHRISLVSTAPVTIKNGPRESHLLLLQGKPIGEPVAQHGPFVMNTPDEIQSAFSDFQRTQFGGWPWPKNDQVHPRESGRFALHADGHKEEKSDITL
ncbi:MAG: pirin family protein [Saprospiraceae bacterium]|nr:pirin family protein [Saprospiraceae bacterium]